MLASAFCNHSHQRFLRRLGSSPLFQVLRQPRTTHDRAAKTHMASGGDEHPAPRYISDDYKPSNKLQGKVALVTGGDSGIGKAVCHCFAQEGATVAFTYLKGSADETIEMLRKAKSEGAGEPIAIQADLGYDDKCKTVVDEVVNAFGRVDILVNNVAQQFTSTRVEEVDEPQLERLFRTNIFAYIFVTRHVLKHMKQGGSIINTTSVNAYLGNKLLVEYTATKGAILAFTRALALQVVDRGIRVNGVAPGPIWTPLIPATMGDEVRHFGEEVPMRRPGQPCEVAPSYVFLASNADSSYVTGQILHPNGGTIVNG